MHTPEPEPPQVHFLNVGDLDLSPLCGVGDGPAARAQVTALIERVTCPDCVRQLNAMLAGALNQNQRQREDAPRGSRNPGKGRRP